MQSTRSRRKLYTRHRRKVNSSVPPIFPTPKATASYRAALFLYFPPTLHYTSPSRPLFKFLFVFQLRFYLNRPNLSCFPFRPLNFFMQTHPQRNCFLVFTRFSPTTPPLLSAPLLLIDTPPRAAFILPRRSFLYFSLTPHYIFASRPLFKFLFIFQPRFYLNLPTPSCLLFRSLSFFIQTHTDQQFSTPPLFPNSLSKNTLSIRPPTTAPFRTLSPLFPITNFPPSRTAPLSYRPLLPIDTPHAPPFSPPRHHPLLSVKLSYPHFVPPHRHIVPISPHSPTSHAVFIPKRKQLTSSAPKKTPPLSPTLSPKHTTAQRNTPQHNITARHNTA